MERLLTKCCWAEVKEIRFEDGINPKLCKGCGKHEPHMEWVEMCDHCKRPERLCNCP